MGYTQAGVVLEARMCRAADWRGLGRRLGDRQGGQKAWTQWAACSRAKDGQTTEAWM